jgi:hypothetical protein
MDNIYNVRFLLTVRQTGCAEGQGVPATLELHSGVGNVAMSNARERQSPKSWRSRCRLPGKRAELANSCGCSAMPPPAGSAKGCWRAWGYPLATALSFGN